MKFRASIVLIALLSLSGCAPKYSKNTADNSAKPKVDIVGMVYIPEGEFIMGCNPEDRKRGMDFGIVEVPQRIKDNGDLTPEMRVYVGVVEMPQTRVFLKAYYIDKYEAVNIEYKRFIDATGTKPPSECWKDNMYLPEEQDNLPVAHISWYDADAYCRWRGKRLPTEAEWEKAARGTDGRIYPWGNTFDKDKANTREWNMHRFKRVPVGSFPDGASPYGAMDMAGNVWEWTADWYKPYPGPGNDLLREASGEIFKVARGGSWDTTGENRRTTARYLWQPYESYQCFIGVRCVKDE